MKKMRNFVILLGLIMLFMMNVPATAVEIKTINSGTTVFIGERSALNITAPENPYKDIRKPFPTLDPNATPYVPGRNQFYITDFSQFLAKWNDKMQWGFSQEQIENYSRTLEDGMLKKYKISPDYPTLNIPDMKPFCLEVGDAIGLSKNQSEVFATAADDELKKDKFEFYKPLLPEPGSKALTEPDTQSAPYAFGKVDYECIFVNFTIPRPIPPSYQFSWTAADRTDVMNDFAIGTQAISNQAPQQASMSNLRYYWPVVTVDGVNPGRGDESTSPNGWMENAIRNLGFEDLNSDGRVSDEFARYWKAYEGADSVVIVYFTHDAMGAYAAGAWWGYADKAVISYWGYNGIFFDAVPGSYEHETVHLFGALDEYVSESSCGEYSIFAVSPMKEMYTNTNHQTCNPHSDVSIMNDLYTYSIISQSSKKFIGWGDYDNDGIIDPLDNSPWGENTKIGVVRDAIWKLDYNNDGFVDTSFQFGTYTDIPITGDWNGDDSTESGVFRPSLQRFILNTTPLTQITFGLSTDIPITGDWNGDGVTDIGVFRPSARQFILNTVPITRITFGLNTDIPITGDWNGDGITDVGVFRPSAQQFILNTVPITRITFGLNTDIPITGDWNGDGITDVGVFRPSAQQFILNTVPITRINFGLSTDIPVTGKWV